jgi:hypothetical protein
MVACRNGPNPAAAEYSTTSQLTLIYDTMAPTLVSNVLALSSSYVTPGAVITLSYSEDLNCERPYAFQVQLVLIPASGDTRNAALLYDAASSSLTSALPLRCTGPLLTMQIPLDISTKIDLPAQVGIRLAGVADLYFNTDPTEHVLPLQLIAGTSNSTRTV